MRNTGAVVAALFACGVVGTAQDAPAEKYVSKDGGYAIRFPAGLEVKTSRQDVPGGLRSYLASAFDKAERRTYVVTYTPHMKGVLKTQAKAVLDLGEKLTLNVANTTKVSVRDFTVGKQKYPARDILSLRDGNQTLTRFVLADPMLYTLVVGGPKEFASGKEATEFVDSLELMPIPKAK